jgi:hypothetical protein
VQIFFFSFWREGTERVSVFIYLFPLPFITLCLAMKLLQVIVVYELAGRTTLGSRGEGQNPLGQDNVMADMEDKTGPISPTTPTSSSSSRSQECSPPTSLDALPLP